MRPGSIFADRFAIEREAGAGGAGTVYRATDRPSGEVVALKVLHRRSSIELERFEREARVLAELRHPNIVRYVAHGTTESEPWLAIEWIDGEDLEARLAREGMTTREALTLCGAIAAALGSAHARGIVHRDIKPSNVMLRGSSVRDPVLLDFGLARALTARGVTVAGNVLGTLGYMAPEQARGELDIDARADVFSLGCVLFECLTGRAAFVGDNFMAVLAKVLFDESPRACDLRPDLPEAVNALVSSLLAKDREQRPRDGGHVASALTAAHGIGVAENGRARASERPPSLTGGEQRLVSALAIASLRADAAAPSSASPHGDDDAIGRVVASYGARLEWLADGSAVVLCAGSGAAFDEALRAARCALALRQAAPRARMALATGRARVGERLPVGEAIDRATALLASTAPSQIRVDPVTAGFLDARFDFRGDADGLSLRGERTIVETTRKLLGRDTPCVGRERELELLRSTFAECVDDEVARAVVVTGSAGIGKSRLRFELVRHVRATDDRCETWMARGDPVSSPFGMVAQLIHRAAALNEGDPPEVSRQLLRARVARHVAPEAVDRVATFLGELISLPLDGASYELAAARVDTILMGDQLRRAFEDFLAAESAHHSILLILEDLQWGDLPSVRFIDAALRTLRDRPLMVLALARPELNDVFPRLWAERAATQVSLPALTRKAVEKIVRGALGDDVQTTLLGDLIERAQGNPFFAEELVRSVVERGSSGLPETVLAVIQARLEDLDGETRRVLRAASIFGQIFWSGGVTALLGGDARTAHVEQCIDLLEEREIIARRGQGGFAGQEDLAFRHGLVRDTAYAMLTDADRKLGHRLAGAWLESVGERDARKLAEHYERGEDKVNAIAAYLRAAEQALEGNDYGVVLACVERALEAGAGGEARGALLWLATEANHWRGNIAEVEARGREAMEWLRRGSAMWYAALGRFATALGRRGLTDRMIAIVSPLLSANAEIVAAGEETDAYVVAMSHLAAQLLYAGHNQVATAIIARIDVLAPQTAMAGWVHDARATRAMIDGDIDGCVIEMERARDAFLRAGDLRNACIQQGHVGYGLMELGERLEAERALRAAWVEASRLGLHHTGATAKHNLGRVLADLGRLDEALDIERRAVDEFAQQGDKRLEGAARRYLAQIHKSRGELDDAEREARAAVAIVSGVPPSRASAVAILAEVLLARGRVNEALEVARDAGDLLDRLGTIEEGAAAIRLALAEALAANGDLGGARTVIAIARDALLEAAARVRDPARRATMLERIPEHARILARARQLGV